MSKVLLKRGFGSLSSSTETNPRDHVKSISTTVEADASSICHIGSHQYAISTEQNSTLMYETRQMTILFLSLGELAHTKLTVELADRTIKYPKGIAKSVLVGIGKFVFLIDFIILDMPEDVKVPLILERPFLSTAHAKIDVFKRKITLRVGEEKISFKSVKPASCLIKRVYMLSLRERMELDLEVRIIGETLVLLDPLILVENLKARNDARMVSKFGYPSDYDHDKKIRIDCAHNLKFSCMIVLEDMDAYCDEGIWRCYFATQYPREVGIMAIRN
ncbi:putative reverse transcriptase domain-containing protein [Tanacetum coccineum]